MNAAVRARIRALVLLGLIACPPAAHAQDVSAAAEALFVKGNTEFKSGNYDAACPAFEESQRLDPRPGTLHALAVCRERQGRIATASALYTDYIRLVEGMSTALKLRHHDRAKDAKQRRDSLAPDIPELTLTLPPGAPEGVTLIRDGVELTAASLGVAIPVDPGEHVLSTRVGDGPEHEQRITLDKGEKKAVEIELPPPAEPPLSAAPKSTQAPTQQPSSSAAAPAASAGSRRVGPPDKAQENTKGSGLSAQRIGSIVAAGVGLAGIGLGAAMGAMVLDSKRIVDAHCVGRVCDAEGAQAVRDVQTPGLVSTIGVGVGAAGLATAVILWFTDSGSQVRAVNGSAPARATIAGTVEIGPAGGLIGLKGAF